MATVLVASVSKGMIENDTKLHGSRTLHSLSPFTSLQEDGPHGVELSLEDVSSCDVRRCKNAHVPPFQMKIAINFAPQ